MEIVETQLFSKLTLSNTQPMAGHFVLYQKELSWNYSAGCVDFYILPEYVIST